MTGSYTRDFRCLRRSGLLPLSCSVPVFESGFVVRLPECGHCFVPRVAAGGRTVPRSAVPAGGAVSPSWRVPAAAAGQEKPGREYGDLRFSGDGLLGRGGVPEFRAGFLGAL
jgi:hypothetical protein